MESGFAAILFFIQPFASLKTVLMTPHSVNGGFRPRPTPLRLSLDFCEHCKAEAIL